ncbi:hypothetical protein FQZ97_1184850 [compost metagenome]
MPVNCAYGTVDHEQVAVINTLFSHGNPARTPQVGRLGVRDQNLGQVQAVDLEVLSRGRKPCMDIARCDGQHH